MYGEARYFMQGVFCGWLEESKIGEVPEKRLLLGISCDNVFAMGSIVIHGFANI